MEYGIIEMSTKHVSQIALLEKECFSSPWSEKAILDELTNNNSHFLVADSEDVLGYIGVQEICGEAYITNIAVFDKYRNLGIGRKLLNKAVEGALLRGCEFITLEVRESNKSAISLYTSVGFEVAGVRKNFYTNPTENGIIYTKYLK